MSMLLLSQAAAAIGAERVGPDVDFNAVTTDSRSAGPGELFVALRGERFDGHQFVAQALAQGATAAVVERGTVLPPGASALLVADTRIALGQLAAHWRSRFAIPVVAVTGSNGKTTVKEMLAGILREAISPEELAAGGEVLATRGNLNNDIGMPLTLLSLRAAHRYAVIEMGMNHPGEIACLTRIARPDVALINNAHAAHLEGLENVGQVARAKGEIFEGLDAGGIAVINADDAYAELWRGLAGSHGVVDFGVEHPAQVTGRYKLGVHGSELALHTPQGDCPVQLQVPGMHNVRNALAAAAAAVALGVANEAIAAGLAGFAGVKGRLQRKPGLHGATLIDDTYNANPGSVRAAIAVLAAAPGKRLLVLGDMGELGPEAEALHRQIGETAKQAGVDMLFALGDLSRFAAGSFGAGGRHFERIQELLAEVENLLEPDVTVLVKGSRFMQMERVVKSFEVGSGG
jgi:UDP-N-acetylmuramoyl-tripeptide--D-alanyl-D-alanine ligase